MTMNKEFEHNGTRFNIKVELDQIVEMGINGRRIHIITVNDMGPGSYYEKYKFEHNGTRFNIKVELDQIVEMGINGRS